jgi:ABC-2 type transport system permease protein
MGLLSISLLKLVRRPASWVVLAILVGPIIVFFLGLAASVGQAEGMGDELQVRTLLGFPAAYTTVIGFILGFGGLLAVVYAAAIIGADWAWGTIRAVVARGESRVRYTLITFLAIVILLGVGILLAFAVGAIAAVLAAEAAGLGSEGATDPDTLAGIPELLGRTWLGVSQQAAIGFAIAMLFRSQLAGIGAGLAFYFAEQFLVLVPLAGHVLPYFPFNVAGSVVATAGEFGDGFGGAVPLDSDSALLWSVGYLVLALAIATLGAWRAQITQ